MDPCVKHNAKYNSFMIKNKNKTNLKNLIVLEIFYKYLWAYNMYIKLQYSVLISKRIIWHITLIQN